MPDGQQWKDFRENYKMDPDRDQCSVSGSNAPPSVTYSNHRSPSKRRKCSKTMAITPFIAEKPTSVLKALPEPTR